MALPLGGLAIDWNRGQDRAKPILLLHMLMAFLSHLQIIKTCLNLVNLREFDTGYIVVNIIADLIREQ